MLGRITKNTTYLTLAFIGQKLLALFYFVIIARVVGAEDLGKYTFALAFTTLFAVLADIGLSQSLIRESAKKPEKEQSYFSAVLCTKILLGVATYGLVFLAINFMGYPAQTKAMVYIAGIVMLLDSLTLSFWALFRGRQILKYEAIGIFVNQILIIISGLTILYFKFSLVFLMIPFVFGSLWNFLFSATLIRKILKLKFSFRLDKKVFKFLFGIAVPFALIAIFMRVYTYLDSVLLSSLAGDRALGYYSVAYKIPFALQVLPAAVGAAIFPAFSEYYVSMRARLKDIFDKAMAALLIIAVPMGFGLFSVAEKVIDRFYGAEYSPAILVLQILSFGLIFLFLGFPLGALLNACDRQKLNAVLVGLTMCLNVVLNIILIPQFQYVGAAIAFLISHFFLFCMALFFARQIIPYSRVALFFTFLKTLVSASVMVGVIFYLQNWNVFLLILVGIPIYFVVLFLLRGFSREQISLLRQVFMRR